MSKKILLAGPGTGKTTRIKKGFLSEIINFDNVLVLSFTNATINDLLKSFKEDAIPITNKNCMTLHSYALKINHKSDFYILDGYEQRILSKCSKKLNLNFNTLCEMLRCITHDQMIDNIIKFFKTNEQYFKDKVGKIDLLIIDEYQDFNENEQKLIDFISNFAKDVIILGDDDQALYGELKGAKSDRLISMYVGEEFKNIEHENVCRRCPDCVVEKAKNLISNNKNRVEKNWEKSGKSGSIKHVQTETQEGAAEKVVKAIKWIKKNDRNSSIMVLSPIEKATVELKKQLNDEGIDFIDFFNRNLDQRMYEAIWKLNLIYGDYKIVNLLFIINKSNITPFKKKKFLEIFSKYTKRGLEFNKFFDDIKSFLDDKLVQYVGNRPNYDILLSGEEWNLVKDNIDLDNLNDENTLLKMVNSIKINKCEFDCKSVNIMSLFKSKGLQADHVFILGLVDGILPRNNLSLDGIEEQRRMFYVGITRAEKNLFLLSTILWPSAYTHKLGRDKFAYDYTLKLCKAQSSPFVEELKL